MIRKGLGLVSCFLLLLYSLPAKAAMTVLVQTSLFHLPKDGKLVPYIETYWQIDPASLQFGPAGNWQSQIKVDIEFRNDTGIFREDHFISQTASAADEAAARSQVIFDLRRYLLDPGKYQMQISFTEVGNEQNRFSFQDSLAVNAAIKTGISAPQLIDTAFKTEVQGPLRKNGIQYVPLCISFLDDYRRTLNYYLELYNLPEDKGPYLLNVFVSKKKDETAVYSLIQNDTVAADKVVPYYGSFAIPELPSGNYYLNAGVYDRSGKELAVSSIFFQRANKKPVQEIKSRIVDSNAKASNEFDTTAQRDVLVFNINKTFLSKYNHAQLRAILKMLLPIADPAEKQNITAFIKKPDELHSRYFIYNFWLSRNERHPDKEWEKYADQVREVNKLFGSSSVPGYESDRGYIYLKYGKPNERVVVGAEQDALPYEVWQYFAVKTQGKDGIFLFYQAPNAVNDFRLLHSTVTGEQRDMNWRNYLYPNGRRDQTDSKAEQYLRNR
jgi:GWxTD domain-containing protein